MYGSCAGVIEAVKSDTPLSDGAVGAALMSVVLQNSISKIRKNFEHLRCSDVFLSFLGLDVVIWQCCPIVCRGCTPELPVNNTARLEAIKIETP